MKWIITTLASCAIVIGTVLVVFGYLRSEPATEMLDADVALINQQIDEARTQAASYGSGALQAMVNMRIEILEVTAALLTQKRGSLLRRVDLVYSVDGEKHRADPKVISDLEAALLVSEGERDRHEADAARYNGGLLQVMSLMNAATKDLEVSQIHLSILAEKYGFPFGFSNAIRSEPVGQVTVQNEVDAL